MLTFDPAFAHQLARESWTFYGVGMAVIALRIYARIKKVGFKDLCPDDYLMLLAAAFYTTLMICLNLIASGGGDNLFVPSEYPTFSEQEIQARIKGSKIVIVSEQAMLNVIYTIKTCLLFMYSRLTVGLTQQRMVQVLAIYVGCCWFATELTFFLACRPFQGYWAVPPPNPQCTTLQNYAIAQACFNISSDFFMIMIPLPLIVKVSLPLKQKLVLLAIFSMGFFVIIAAICTKVFNLADLYSTVYMLWYIREASVALYVSNLPMIWPVLCKSIPFLRGLALGGDSSYKSSRHNSARSGSNTHKSHAMSALSHKLGIRKSNRALSSGSSNGDDPELDKYYGTSVTVMAKSPTLRCGSLDSDERAINITTAPPVSKSVSDPSFLPPGSTWTGAMRGMRGITAETTFEIEEENLDLERQGRSRSPDGKYDWDHDGGNKHHVVISAPRVQLGRASGERDRAAERRDKRPSVGSGDFQRL